MVEFPTWFVTMTLYRVVLHTVMHHSSTSTYAPNFIEIEETFCGRTYGRTDGHLRLALLGPLGEVDLKRATGVKGVMLSEASVADLSLIHI